MATQSPQKFSDLNQLGCTDELNTRLSQIEGVLGALLNGGADSLNEHLLSACLQNIFTLTNESQQLVKQQYSFVPRNKQ